MTARTRGALNLCLNFKSNMFTGAAQATFMHSKMCVQLDEQCVCTRVLQSSLMRPGQTRVSGVFALYCIQTMTALELQGTSTTWTIWGSIFYVSDSSLWNYLLNIFELTFSTFILKRQNALFTNVTNLYVMCTFSNKGISIKRWKSNSLFESWTVEILKWSLSLRCLTNMYIFKNYEWKCISMKPVVKNLKSTWSESKLKNS